MTINDWRGSLPRSLVDAARDRKVVPFVGAGLSIPFGIPNWREIIVRLGNRCDEEKKPNTALIRALLEEGDFLQAALVAKNKLGRDLYRRELESALTGYDRGKPLTTHKLLWDLKPPLIITTNLDTLLEDAHDGAKVITPIHQSKLLEMFSTTKSDVLFKVHGSIDEFESVVFARDEYDRLSNEFPAYQLSFKTPILQNTLLFVGFGLTDPAVLHTLESLRTAFADFTGTHYALVQQGERSVREIWERYRIHVIEYPEHFAIDHILQALAGAKDTPASGTASQLTLASAEPQTSAAPRRLTASERIPASLDLVRNRAIDECIVLATNYLDNALQGWHDRQVLITCTPRFFRPRGILERVLREMERSFEKMRYVSTPRYSLTQFRMPPKSNVRYNELDLTTELTEWALVHGIQSVLAQDTPVTAETRDLFWQSAESMVASQNSLLFPHHLVVHPLVVSGDNRVILNKRVNVENQRERISASFEEQLQFAFIFPGDENRPKRIMDSDMTAFDAIRRGAQEELNIELSPEDCRILALAMESSSIAANLLAFCRSKLTASEIYRSWQAAEDRQENLMIPPELAPEWNVDSMCDLLSRDVLFPDSRLYQGRWHASSKARIFLAMLHDFGVDAVRRRLSFDADALLS